jgi:hypothetical protein
MTGSSTSESRPSRPSPGRQPPRADARGGSRVGHTGFEPVTSCVSCKRASQLRQWPVLTGSLPAAVRIAKNSGPPSRPQRNAELDRSVTAPPHHQRRGRPRAVAPCSGPGSFAGGRGGIRQTPDRLFRPSTPALPPPSRTFPTNDGSPQDRGREPEGDASPEESVIRVAARHKVSRSRQFAASFRFENGTVTPSVTQSHLAHALASRGARGTSSPGNGAIGSSDARR